MATRRDQLQSYQFMLQRIVSALVYRKTDPAESPFRRAGGAVFAGLMLSIFALAITAVIGLFATGCGKTASWREGKAIIKEEESGSYFVVLPPKSVANGKKQKLYETANFASAALLAGTTDVFEIKAKSLRDDDDKISMGPRVGIPNAPNFLPKADALSADDWSLCSFPAGKDEDEPTSKLYIGTTRTSGKSLGGKALLAQAGEEQFLISQGHKYKIDADGINALNASGQTVHDIDKAVLAGIESGAPLEAPDFGDPEETSDVADVPVGTVYRNDGGGNVTYWVARKDDTAAITELQAYLIVGGKDSEFKDDSAPENTGDLMPDKDNTPLTTLPKYAEAAEGSKLCALFPATGKDPKIMYNAKTPDVDGVDTPTSSTRGKSYVDQVVVEPGTGALVETGTEEDAGGVSLVTSSGEIFGIEQTQPDSGKKGSAAPTDAMTAFKYRGEKGVDPPEIVNMPTQVLTLLPEGPELSPDLAMQTVVG